MKHLVFLYVLLFCVYGQANLLSSIQIEEAYRQKIQSFVDLFDSEARVIVKFEYKRIDGTLPGTVLSAQNETPTVIDTNDIVRAKVFIISNKEKFSDKFESILKGLIPVDSSKISVVIEKKTSEMVRAEKETIKAQDLRNITNDSMEKVLKHITILVLSIFALAAVFGAYFSSRSLKAFKNQMTQVQEALLSQSATPVNSPMLSESSYAKSYSSNMLQPGSEDLVARQLAHFDPKQMLAILSDCYWCHLDGEAAWLWKRLEMSQKRELIALWLPLGDYSKFLLTQDEYPTNLYQDSFYYSAQDIKDLDNSALYRIIEQTPQAWSLISSVRQKNIPISLELGLKLTSNHNVDRSYKFESLVKSDLRIFETSNMVSDLSLEDELRILNEPEFIPSNMRRNVPSLCWLASKDSEYIISVLSQFDARSLATAWVGPEAVLEKFESYLSEKKLKALKSYLLVSQPSRKSDSFMKLHQMGLVNEAA